jgi:hypothetical protein
VSIDYALAQELKDAEFPQEITPQFDASSFHDISYAPTLSELIEACDYKFITIENEFGYDWMATPDLDETQRCYGATPEEAVARLWLALNKTGA